MICRRAYLPFTQFRQSCRRSAPQKRAASLPWRARLPDGTIRPMTAHILPPQISPPTANLARRVETAAEAAAAHADAVDGQARFPGEAVAALRAERLMSIMVPADFGGEGAGVGDVVDICYALGRACASTAMIFAMHQIMVAILVRHAGDSAWHQRLLRHVCAEQW